MPIYAIGDLQGCYEELTALLKKINFHPEQDRLWFTGDLINRGPYSLKCLRYVSKLANKPMVVLGNHDLHFLALAYDIIKPSAKDTCVEILNADDCGDLVEWLRQQYLCYYDLAIQFTLTHAGVYPTWSRLQALEYANEVEMILQSDHIKSLLENMYGNHPTQWSDALTGWERYRFIINSFTRMRYCTPSLALDLKEKLPPQNVSKDLIPWYAVKHRVMASEKIIFGHWAALNGEINFPNLYALDTGCVWGNALTAMELDTDSYISTPSLQPVTR